LIEIVEIKREEKRVEKINIVQPDDEEPDTTFGVKEKHGIMVIGDEDVTVKLTEEGIKVGNTTYKSTTKLWDLIRLKKPKSYTAEYLNDYADNLLNTGAMRHEETPNKPISSKEYKYRETFLVHLGVA
jgi:hypothetical protein